MVNGGCVYIDNFLIFLFLIFKAALKETNSATHSLLPNPIYLLRIYL